MLKTYPFYIKATIILFGLILFVYTLGSLRNILTPVCFALLLAILLNRLVVKFQKLKVSKTWSIIISLVIAFTVMAGVGYFLTSQILSFGDDMPVLKKRFIEIFAQLQQLINNKLGFSIQKQDKWLAQAGTGVQSVIGQTLGTVAGSLGILLLLPVYTFLLLFYKNLILNFLHEVFADEDEQKVVEVLQETKTAIEKYMVGLLLEGMVVAILNTSALLLIGVKYAVLLGVIGAILNVLPYIGGVIAILLPVIIATITKDGLQTQLAITAAYLVIQFIDNHLLIPLIVSSRVKINAFISIFIVLLGGALWGVSGMFLSIPFIGVLKIVFDRVEELKPWGKLLGTEVPTVQKLKLRKRNKIKAA